jgi:peptide methionine sulfoxide reductase MsrB
MSVGFVALNRPGAGELLMRTLLSGRVEKWCKRCHDGHVGNRRMIQVSQKVRWCLKSNSIVFQQAQVARPLINRNTNSTRAK